MIDTPEPVVAAGRRRLVVACVVLVLLAGLGWWGTHPNRFGPVGNTIGTKQAVVGAPQLYGVGVGPSSDVVLRDVRARVHENTADARIRVVVCEADEVLGSALGSAESWCRKVLATGGATLHPLLRDVSPQLVVEITPRKPGHVFIDGVDISYRSGLRYGWESTGTEIDVTAP